MLAISGLWFRNIYIKQKFNSNSGNFCGLKRKIEIDSVSLSRFRSRLASVTHLHFTKQQLTYWDCSPPHQIIWNMERPQLLISPEFINIHVHAEWYHQLKTHIYKLRSYTVDLVRLIPQSSYDLVKNAGVVGVNTTDNKQTGCSDSSARPPRLEYKFQEKVGMTGRCTRQYHLTHDKIFLKLNVTGQCFLCVIIAPVSQ